MIEDGNEVMVIDVTVPFENDTGALQCAEDRKVQKKPPRILFTTLQDRRTAESLALSLVPLVHDILTIKRP